MSKSILAIDTPKACIDCPCHFADDVMIWCGKERKEIFQMILKLLSLIGVRFRICQRKGNVKMCNLIMIVVIPMGILMVLTLALTKF